MDSVAIAESKRAAQAAIAHLAEQVEELDIPPADKDNLRDRRGVVEAYWEGWRRLMIAWDNDVKHYRERERAKCIRS